MIQLKNCIKRDILITTSIISTFAPLDEHTTAKNTKSS